MLNSQEGGYCAKNNMKVTSTFYKQSHQKHNRKNNFYSDLLGKLLGPSAIFKLPFFRNDFQAFCLKSWTFQVTFKVAPRIQHQFTAQKVPQMCNFIDSFILSFVWCNLIGWCFRYGKHQSNCWASVKVRLAWGKDWTLGRSSLKSQVQPEPGGKRGRCEGGHQSGKKRRSGGDWEPPWLRLNLTVRLLPSTQPWSAPAHICSCHLLGWCHKL